MQFASHSRLQAGLTAFLTLISIAFWGNTALAADGWTLSPYLRLDAGYSNTVNNDGTIRDATQKYIVDVFDHRGSRYQAGFGVKLTDYLRSDVTLSYRGNLARTNNVTMSSGTVFETKDGNHTASNMTALLNIYVDPLAAVGIDTGAFSSYVQAGIGRARNKTKSMKFSSTVIQGATHNNVAWQVGAGLNYALTDQWKIDLSYRFLDMGEARSSKNFVNGVTPNTLVQETRFDLQAHEVLLGLQYQF
tara:strand:- start:22 stop:762 length:741 start_codon:yes stop_codon:yes gene_type:complete